MSLTKIGEKMKFYIVIISLLFVVVGFSFYNLFDNKQIAYVNTGKLMIAFSEANKIEKEIKVLEDDFKAKAKILEDTLQATIDLMSKEYDKAKPARKKELQDLLSARNKELNNYSRAKMKEIEKVKAEKMKMVFDKINVYMAEFGKKHRYKIIFGTTSGNILYADDGSVDITDEIIKGLNNRYK